MMLMRDLRLALRGLLRRPGFTAVAVVTLALGMGANTAFFSVLYGIVLRDAPYPAGRLLVELRNMRAGQAGDGDLISRAELLDFRTRQRVFAGIGGAVRGRATLIARDGADRVLLTRVTSNLFPLLGVAPVLGRGFTEADEQPGNDRSVLISHDFWQSAFAGSADVVGRSVVLNAVAHTVIGVMPAGFSYAEPGTAIWKPLDVETRGPSMRANRELFAVARLAPGRSIEDAEHDMRRLAAQLQQDEPATYPPNSGWSIRVKSMRDMLFGHMAAPLGALMAAAAAVLLIACVNVSVMFLLRAAARSREVRIRLAFGAARRHILSQLFAESAVVCVLGTAGGMALAVVMIEALKAFPPGDVPRLQEVAINAPVAAFTAGVLVLVCVVIALTPAAGALRMSVNDAAQTGRSSESRGTVRLRESLTVIEIALAVLLLATAGLTFRSLQNLLGVDVGFSTSRLLTFKTNLTEAAYPDAASTNRFYDGLTARLQALPGVTSVGAVSYLPLSNESTAVDAIIPDSRSAVPGPAGVQRVGWRVASGAYFESMGLRLVIGRDFGDLDRLGAPLVTVVDEELAKRFWGSPGQALGREVRFGTGERSETRRVVGVVQRARHTGPAGDPLPDAYVPQTQYYQRGMYTVVKTTGSASALIAAVRARLTEVDPAVPMYFVETMEDRYAASIALPRFVAGLIAAFSTLALVLATVGIFGVTAYSVAQRARAFGIRFALGAQRTHVARLVLGRVGYLTVIGAILGTGAAYGVARLLGGLLFGVAPADVSTLVGVALIIGIAALTATLAPLARAVRVNPADALRAE